MKKHDRDIRLVFRARRRSALALLALMVVAGTPLSTSAQNVQTAATSPAAADANTPAASATSTAPATTSDTPATYSAASLYNLANSYARAGKPGLAVLNYERASLLAPNDPDIEANLRYVRESAHLPAQSQAAWKRAFTLASPGLLSCLGVLGMLLLGLALLAGERYPVHRWKRRAAALAGWVLVGAAAGNALVLWPTLHAAVIVSAATPVQVSPVPMGDQLFTLPEAQTVTIMAEHEDFVLIKTDAGRQGWVSRADLVPVVPAHSGT